MASFDSSFFIGSVVMPRQDFKVNGIDVSIAGGEYYLYDLSSPLSLLSQMQAALAAGGVALGFAVLLGSGYVRLSGSAAFTVAWGTASVLKELLGYSVDLASATGHVAPKLSPIFWSPQRKARFELTPDGVRGMRQHILHQSVSAYSGKAESTSHGAREFQKWSWEKIPYERLMTANALAGEFDTFFERVAVRSARFKVYHIANEDTLSTSQFTFDVALGPYVMPLGNNAGWQYTRASGHTWTDFTADLTVSATVCPEIDY